MISPAEHYAYLFEAKGIQSFIGDSGRLIDLVGGSDLIAGIAAAEGDDLLADSLSGREGIELSRRSGASFCLHSKECSVLKDFRDAWLLRFCSAAPGLAYVDNIVGPFPDAGTARREAYASQTGLRLNGASTLLPLGRPGIAFAPRTGRPSTMKDYAGDGSPMDRTVALVRSQGRTGRDRLAARFVSRDANIVFPRHFELEDATTKNPAFPFRQGSDDRRVGVVHADISRLGQTFITVSKLLHDSGDVLQVATTVEGIIADAAKNATEKVVRPAGLPPDQDAWRAACGLKKGQDLPEEGPVLLPMRPVLLGGDDMTAIVRADLAVQFAERFLLALEGLSRERLSKLWSNLDIEPPVEVLTAGVGVAIQQSSHPFPMVSYMAETMCDHAKTILKGMADRIGPRSGITFAVVPMALGESYDTFRRRELMTRDMMRTAAPYLLEPVDECGLLPIATLYAVAKGLADVDGASKLRGMFHADPANAQALFDRFEMVLRVKYPKKFHELKQILGSADADLPPVLEVAGVLCDALELLDIGAIEPRSAALESEALLP
ncbi:MAG: hypothetical protein ACU0CI_06370 [Shimia sp.]